MSQPLKLSIKQERAVLHTDGSILVIASAGSGKTRVLTERIKLLLSSTKRKVLAITFTNKAGEEMKERLGDSTIIKNQVFVGTFHSFCQQVLELRGNLIGLSTMPHIFEDETDRLQLIEEAIETTPSFYFEYKKSTKKDQLTFRYKILEYISTVKRELLSEDDLLEQSEGQELILLYNNYQEILSSQNAIDFDDLIKLTCQLFVNNPAVASQYRRTYEYICIDEAQDLNKAQYQLIKSITQDEHKNIMLVGDPNQSIFAFNGSSSDFMCKHFVNDFNPTVIELKENYRSSRKVIEAADMIIQGSNNIVNHIIPGIFEIFPCDDERNEADLICSKINELISLGTHNDIEGIIEYEKIAILARNKYVFNQLEILLKELSLPYYFKISAGAIKFESTVMRAFDLMLRVKINPSDNLHKTELSSLLKVQDINEFINSERQDWRSKIIKLVVNLKDDGSNLKSSLVDFATYVVSTDNTDDAKKMVLDEIDEVQKHWLQYAKKTDNKSLHQFKNAMALGQTNHLATPNGITLSTVHTMKGQEYDIVFLMGMDEGTFPDYRAINKGGAELIQEKNNAYVAFTRSKRFLYVTFPKTRTMPWGDTKSRYPSRFLQCFFNDKHTINTSP